MYGIWLILFAVVAGFTASGVAASLYRCSGINSKTQSGKIVGTAVLVLAGPSVIFQMAMNGLRKKEWKPLTCWIVVAGLTYWSLAIGLLILDIVSGF
jgi:heme/copper-type cytochrome/quinol oxidase subunit 3